MQLPPTLQATLVSGKLNAPMVSAHHVTRHALREQICLQAPGKVVLLRGPAGYGKTSLLAQCRDEMLRSSISVTWLTLDRSDNDAVRFLHCLCTALRNLTAPQNQPSINTPAPARDPATAAVDSSRLPHTDVLELALTVKTHIASLAHPFAVFLDDFESITERSVLDLVQDLISDFPHHGSLLIGTRHVPSLHLGRLRSRGKLLEIDAAQLCFSHEETAGLFADMAPPLRPADIDQLHRKTEGWIAALWLVSLSLSRHADASAFVARFSGTEQSIAEYLAQDVLAGLPDEVRYFLLRTSILKRLNAPLCQALLPDFPCAALLTQLESTHLLLGSDGLDDHSYRYHSLFAAYLQAQLRAEAPSEIATLHRRASAWFLQQNRPVPAIDHAIDGGDFGLAIELLQTHAARLAAEGRMGLLARWFAQIPPATLATQPVLQALQIWATCMTRGPSEASLLMNELKLAAHTDPAVQRHVRTLRPLLLSMMDCHEQAYEIGMPGIAALQGELSFTETALLNAMANVAAVLGRYQDARRWLDTARRAQGVAASRFNHMYSEAVEGIIDLQEGRMRQAGARFLTAVHATHRDMPGPVGGNAWAGVLYAAWVYETGDLAQASRLLAVYVPLGRDVALPDHMILGYLMLSRIAFLNGDTDRTFYLLGELEYLGHQRRLPRIAASARVERARFLLLQGHSSAARDELLRAEDDDLWQRVERLRLPANDLLYPRLGKLRWACYAGNHSDLQWAIAELERDTDAAIQAGRYRRAFKMRLLTAVACEKLGQDSKAHTLLAQALQTAVNEDLCRVIADEGTAVADLLTRFHAAPAGQRWLSEEPRALPWLQKYQLQTGLNLVPQAADTSAILTDPLTTKETRVLELLAEGHSNISIARKLFVSENTVRTHLRNLNIKLQAANRTQAVAQARKAGLL
ncbi:Serine/threonine-protein kinase pknK [Bordetella tumbae]|uniref:LuxR C-terminal-related transcriptional regulator n=1 Tax=Bordetella tumbae TaxID=1649139 RepID=UPI0039F10B51